MSQLSFVKDQLLGKALNHFVIIAASGKVVDYSGDFENAEKQQLAYTILQQCAPLLKSNEQFKRIVMSFDEVTYVATTVTDEGVVYSVIVKRPVNTANGTG
ncbi:hypothetical protein STCU_02290 [Strigomonas culicis]|uniref:Late endosomal/lysosomal adaptor and MAPK and MTOR activator 4 n=1 Tax=Strigomonas culicis TaxID=28005 RepID=S9VYP6_9TRYP|nr:hypothetical protein STCU_02917 [Strigomonas culicis]EPY33338.1 hypothetical protein STCU_02290 [Strigomonas culicis]|eukprot:EPY32226.1 hypothetical protein STCU_02917 [Strigomonas culicis]